jgi:hypothetical protein
MGETEEEIKSENLWKSSKEQNEIKKEEKMEQ